VWLSGRLAGALCKPLMHCVHADAGSGGQQLPGRDPPQYWRAAPPALPAPGLQPAQRCVVLAPAVPQLEQHSVGVEQSSVVEARLSGAQSRGHMTCKFSHEGLPPNGMAGCEPPHYRDCDIVMTMLAGSVPSGIALHDRLEALDLRNNRLDTIPPEWTNAPNTLVAQAPLVYLRIAGNQFTVSMSGVWHAGRVPLL
jgi:hypothetical protein